MAAKSLTAVLCTVVNFLGPETSYELECIISTGFLSTEL